MFTFSLTGLPNELLAQLHSPPPIYTKSTYLNRVYSSGTFAPPSSLASYSIAYTVWHHNNATPRRGFLQACLAQNPGHESLSYDSNTNMVLLRHVGGYICSIGGVYLSKLELKGKGNDRL